eukprot:m.984323 g.984323  ORF g.984323 m.984323 type:complete len:655 (-) comp23978_c0_seq2:1702-3666(-)
MATSTSPLIQFCAAVASAAQKQRTGLITREEFDHVFAIQDELARMYLEEAISTCGVEMLTADYPALIQLPTSLLYMHADGVEAVDGCTQFCGILQRAIVTDAVSLMLRQLFVDLACDIICVRRLCTSWNAHKPQDEMPLEYMETLSESLLRPVLWLSACEGAIASRMLITDEGLLSCVASILKTLEERDELASESSTLHSGINDVQPDARARDQHLHRKHTAMCRYRATAIVVNCTMSHVHLRDRVVDNPELLQSFKRLLDARGPRRTPVHPGRMAPPEGIPTGHADASPSSAKPSNVDVVEMLAAATLRHRQAEILDAVMSAKRAVVTLVVNLASSSDTRKDKLMRAGFGRSVSECFGVCAGDVELTRHVLRALTTLMHGSKVRQLQLLDDPTLVPRLQAMVPKRSMMDKFFLDAVEEGLPRGLLRKEADRALRVLLSVHRQQDTLTFLQHELTTLKTKARAWAVRNHRAKLREKAVQDSLQTGPKKPLLHSEGCTMSSSPSSCDGGACADVNVAGMEETTAMALLTSKDRPGAVADGRDGSGSSEDCEDSAHEQYSGESDVSFENTYILPEIDKQDMARGSRASMISPGITLAQTQAGKNTLPLAAAIPTRAIVPTAVAQSTTSARASGLMELAEHTLTESQYAADTASYPA